MSETTATPVAEQPEPPASAEQILRYRPGQRYIHLLVAVSFTVLFLSGLPLIFEPLSFLAAGGYSRIVHRVAAVAFMAVPILYFIVDREGAKELVRESFVFERDDFRWLMQMGQYALGNAKDMPPQGRLNAGQKLHHALVMVLSAGVVFSGLLLWIGPFEIDAPLQAWTVVIHNVTMGALVLLLVGHVYFTVVYKAINNMHTGYMPRYKARIEHQKWLAELEEQKGSASATDTTHTTDSSAEARED